MVADHPSVRARPSAQAVSTRCYEKGLVQEGAYNALKERMIEIGADDLDAPISEDDEAPKPAAPKIRPVRRRQRATASAQA